MSEQTAPDRSVDAVIWHDVENGSYRADLALWRRLAGAGTGPVLELGCGSGRVALDLAAHGHDVVGVDDDPALVDALNERARRRRLPARAVHGDARVFEHEEPFELVVAPMQVLQVLGGAGERRRAMGAVSGLLAAGGRAAFAIIEGVPEPAQAGDGRSPAGVIPDVLDRDGWVYSSLPLGAVADGDRIVVTRLRQRVSPEGDLVEETHRDVLTVVEAAGVEAEAREMGLRPVARERIPDSDLHVGSTVVVLEAG